MYSILGIRPGTPRMYVIAILEAPGLSIEIQFVSPGLPVPLTSYLSLRIRYHFFR